MSFKNSIGYLIHELAQQLDTESDQILSERYGIGFAQFKVLLVLEEKENITQKEIAIKLSQTEASISRQIKILQIKGLVKNRIDPSNRRQHCITLTPRGVEITHKASHALNVYHSPKFDRVSEKNQNRISETLMMLKSILRQ